MQTVGESIRALRRAQGESQRGLAERCGLSGGFISMLESGAKQPSMSALQRIAAALDVSVSRLLAEPQAAGERTSLRDRPSPPVVPASRQGEHFGQTRSNAEHTLRDTYACRRLVSEASVRAHDEDAWRLGDVRGDLLALIELLDHYATGAYRAVAWENMTLAVAALLYLVSPVDVVPDYLAEGYLDDAAVLAFVAEMIGPDLDTFTAWQQQRAEGGS